MLEAFPPESSRENKTLYSIKPLKIVEFFLACCLVYCKVKVLSSLSLRRIWFLSPIPVNKMRLTYSLLFPIFYSSDFGFDPSKGQSLFTKGYGWIHGSGEIFISDLLHCSVFNHDIQFLLDILTEEFVHSFIFQMSSEFRIIKYISIFAKLLDIVFHLFFFFCHNIVGREGFEPPTNRL